MIDKLDNIDKDKSPRIDNTIVFTKDQEKAINGIIDFIAVPFDPSNHIIGLTGAGGTGKTFITKYIVAIINAFTSE